MSTESRKKFKIVMFGDYGYLTYRVGKLSLVNQFINKHPTFMFSRKEFRFTKNVSIDKNDVILEIKIIKITKSMMAFFIKKDIADHYFDVSNFLF